MIASSFDSCHQSLNINNACYSKWCSLEQLQNNIVRTGSNSQYNSIHKTREVRPKVVYIAAVVCRPTRIHIQELRPLCKCCILTISSVLVYGTHTKGNVCTDTQTIIIIMAAVQGQILIVSMGQLELETRPLCTFNYTLGQTCGSKQPAPAQTAGCSGQLGWQELRLLTTVIIINNKHSCRFTNAIFIKATEHLSICSSLYTQ